jgi:hypothetical protein
MKEARFFAVKLSKISQNRESSLDMMKVFLALVAGVLPIAVTSVQADLNEPYFGEGDRVLGTGAGARQQQHNMKLCKWNSKCANRGL